MNFPFELILCEEGDYATLYSFRILDHEGRYVDEEHTEFDGFCEDPEVREAPDFDPLLVRLDDCLDRLGLYARDDPHSMRTWFRPENDYRDPDDTCCALWAPIPSADLRDLGLQPPFPTLRLYGFRLEQMLIAGCGGVKRDLELHKPINAPLKNALDRVQHVQRRLRERLRDGSVRVAERGFLLQGDLSFSATPPYLL